MNSNHVSYYISSPFPLVRLQEIHHGAVHNSLDVLTYAFPVCIFLHPVRNLTSTSSFHFQWLCNILYLIEKEILAISGKFSRRSNEARGNGCGSGPLYFSRYTSRQPHRLASQKARNLYELYLPKRQAYTLTSTRESFSSRILDLLFPPLLASLSSFLRTSTELTRTKIISRAGDQFVGSNT